jgi:pyruvate/2-oxoglutarate dehydrogenase complex dihydrolipoamide acyltransferase (E2) component
MQQNDYQLVRYSRSRQGVADMLSLAAGKHIIHALIEIDVTEARRAIEAEKARSGEDLSFTAYIVACVGRAVAQDRRVQAYRYRRSQLIVFDDVDVNTLVERVSAGGEKVVLPYVVRAADRKAYRDISREIRQASAQQTERMTPPVMRHMQRLITYAPGFARRLALRLAARDPRRWRRWGGTVAVTSVGMFGTGGGWGIPIVPNTLTITLGGIAAKPGIVDGRIEARDYLSVTISFDHDIVDGAPAARFAGRLKQIIEDGSDLVADAPPGERESERAR